MLNKSIKKPQRSDKNKFLYLLFIISIFGAILFFSLRQSSDLDLLNVLGTKFEQQFILLKSKIIYPKLLINRYIAIKKTDHPDNIFPLRKLLLDRDFVALHSKIVSYQKKFEENIENETAFDLVFILTFRLADPQYETILNEWVKSNPDSYIPYLARGYYFSHMGSYTRGGAVSAKLTPGIRKKMHYYDNLALEDINQVIALNPKITITYSAKISLAMKLGDEKLEKDTLQAGLAINPASYEIRKSYLFALHPLWGGTKEEMLAFLEDTKKYAKINSKLLPLSGFYHYVDSSVKYYRSDFKEAKRAINIALKDGKKAWYYHQLGLIYHYLDEYHLAIEAHNYAIELWPYYQDAILWRAAAYMKKNMLAEALNDIDFAEEINPYSFDYFKRHADILLAFGKDEGALAYYKKAASVKAHNAFNWYKLAWVADTKLNDRKTAVAAYQKSIALDPYNAQFLYDYALTLNKMKDCKVSPVLKKYYTLCQGRDGSKSGCYTTRIKWAKEMIAFVKKIPTCAAQLKEDEKPINTENFDKLYIGI